MNIHFTDKNLFENLILNSVVEVQVGSHLYNLNNTNSDIDNLYIYIEDNANRNSFMWEHHQLQYKGIGVNNISIDYNFTSLQGFIRNTLSGDATINYEVLFSDELRDSKLNWLWERKHDFRNYNIIKSYLGLAKRDHKYWSKDTNNGKKHTLETHKKLSHFIRGVIFAKNLFDRNFSLDLSKTTTFEACGYNDYDLVHRIKHGTLDYSFEATVKFFWILMEDTRRDLNLMLNDRNIVSFMDIDKLKELDNLTMDFIADYIQYGDVDYLDYGNLFYETMENGLNYN